VGGVTVATSTQTRTDHLDPVTFELLRYSFDIVTDEILLTIVRGAHTSIIRDSLDVSVALFDADGQMAAQGFCIPLHLGAIPDAVEEILHRFEGNIFPEDVFILNDPYTGGMHLPDIFVIKPVFIEDGLLAFLVSIGDFGDVGGRVPGGRPLDAKTVYEEGLRIPPIKYVDAGRQIPQIREIIAQNVRLPDETTADLDLCLAAVRAGERALLETVDRFGAQSVRTYMSQVQDYTERVARQVISTLPNGSVTFEDYLDDAVTVPDPIVIRVALEVVDDELRFDFTGSSEQVPSSLNSTLSFAKSAIYAAVRTLMPRDLPNNAGLFRAIKVSAPVGSVMNPLPPSAVAERGITGFRIVDAVQGALAQVAPGRVPAAGEGGASAFRFAGRTDAGDAVIAGDSLMGAWGGQSDRDGVDGIANFAANASNRPVEILEAEGAVRVLKYGFVPDSGGPGRFRGGLSLEREWEILCEEAIVSCRVDRARFAPWGLDGGLPGAKATTLLHTADGWNPIPGKGHYNLRRADRLLHQQASGGGYGDPRERAPQAVLADWLEEKVTTQHALDAYGVVIDPVTKSIDLEATETARGGRSSNARPDTTP
jgi:N-methylhydantoinase B